MADNTKEQALAYKKQGNEHYKAKAYAEAVAEYTKAIELYDQDHTFFSNRSACYAQLKDFENSLGDADKVIELKPDIGKGYTRKILALKSLGRPLEQIKDAYKAGLTACPNDPKLTQGLQELMQAQGRGLIPKQAFMSLMLDPEISSWYQSDAGFKEKVDRCTNGMPNQSELLAWLQDDKFKTLLSKIGMFGGPPNGPGQTQDAPPQRQAPQQKKEPTPPPKEVELSPEEKEFKEREDRADALKKQGTEQYRAKNFDEALRLYTEASEVVPERPVYVLNQAAVYLMMGDLDACEERCKTAVEVSREHLCDYSWDAKAYNRLATVYEKRGDLQQALNYLELSLQEVGDKKVRARMKQMKQAHKKQVAEALINPEEALEWKAKADDAFRAGKWTEAISLYGESVKRNPGDPKVYNNRSTALCKVMGWETALEDATKAIQLSPQWVKPYLRKAKVEQALQKYHRALQTLKAAKLVVENPNDVLPALVALQQDIARANMNPDTAKERQKRALEDPEIQRILKDPVITGLLKQAESDPSQIQKAMRESPRIADSIDMLAAAGIIM